MLTTSGGCSRAEELDDTSEIAETVTGILGGARTARLDPDALGGLTGAALALGEDSRAVYTAGSRGRAAVRFADDGEFVGAVADVVAQRVADLMAGGADPAGIIAFTFTERAATELKARISARVEHRLGAQALDRLGAAFVGTIHAYSFRLLQQHVPHYEMFDVLDERRLTAFLCRQERTLDLRRLTGKVFTSIGAFLTNLDAVENELIPFEALDEPFREWPSNSVSSSVSSGC